MKLLANRKGLKARQFSTVGTHLRDRLTGQHVRRVGLAIRRSRIRALLRPFAGFVLDRPEFKSSATLVNSQMVASCQLGFLIMLCRI